MGVVAAGELGFFGWGGCELSPLARVRSGAGGAGAGPAAGPEADRAVTMSVADVMNSSGSLAKSA